jgi:hypothetical protein
MNFFISVLGWFLWNWAEITIREKQLREDGDPTTVFRFGEFSRQKVYTWVGSAACIPLLLWIGSSELGLKPLESLIGHELAWTDFYLLASGPAFEIIIFAIGQIDRILKKKASE